MGAKKFVYLVQDLSTYGLEQFDVGYIEAESEQKTTIFFLRTGQLLELEANFFVEFDIATTGDRFEYKVCDRCYKHLNTEFSFEDNRIKKDNIKTKRPSCRECRKIKNGKNISSKERAKWEAIKPVNGSLFTCPICKKTTIVGISKVVLDHNHQTGAVRGWLCESCNTGIGRFDDHIDIVKNAIEWLKKDKQ